MAARKFKKFQYDLLVIGSGPAGKGAAIQAAKLGHKIAIIERYYDIGGVSVHTGTLPSKTLRETVLYLTGWKQRGFYGQSHRVKEKITAADITQRVQTTINHEVEVLDHKLYRNGVEILQGTASFTDPHTLQVIDNEGNSNTYTAKHILIATGTHPHRPANIPFDGERIVDSDELLSLKEIPRRMAIVGAGVIGVEYATIFSSLDTEVTLIESRDQILDFVDKEIIDEFLHHLRDTGMVLRFGQEVADIQRNKQDKVVISLKSGRCVISDMVLFAAGRTGASDQLDLDKAGLKADNRGRLSVNEQFQTSVSHIYAAGDIIGFPSLAATSMEQGRLATCHMFKHVAHSQPELFPYGIYAVPEMSMVGKTEKELHDAGIPYESGVALFRETARGQILGTDQGLLKMLFSLENRQLLGVHIVGENATELIHIGQAVMALEGTLDYFVETAFNYPTLAETYKIAALNAWNRMAEYRPKETANEKVTDLKAAGK